MLTAGVVGEGGFASRGLKTVHRTVFAAKRHGLFSSHLLKATKQNHRLTAMVSFWWEKVDSNHRSH